jgi:eukaryotic-like serine/threonine-protein kinase
MASTEERGALDRTVEASPRNPSLQHVVLDARRFHDGGAPQERYLAMGPLGSGGMGEVRACSDQHLNRVVAMKVLRAEHVPHPETLGRFMCEVQVQAQLEHPSVVPVYDVGVLDGAPFLTMKRVRGITLSEVLERLDSGDEAARALYPTRKLLAAFTTVCLTVDYAHARGVVHRDLKPSNVMLGDFGEVYVLDWGVAKVLSGAAGNVEEPVALDPALGDGRGTVVGSLVGTPGYLAPELLRGETDLVDARTDVFALGAMLFEILALEPLHPGDSWQERAAATVAGPDVAALARARARGAPPELLLICEKATAQDRGERFASARELNDAVDRFLAGERDSELRRGLSRQHADAAREAAASALEGGPSAAEARERAIREVSRALAFDPDNGDAMRTLVRLVSEPPRELPAEVQAEIDRGMERVSFEFAPFSSLAYALFLGLAPFVLWMGVRSWTLAIASGLVTAICALASYYSFRILPPGATRAYPVLAVSTLAMTVAATMFGSLVLVPGLAVVNTMFFVLHMAKERVWITILAGAVPIVVPPLLEWVGLLPPAYAFHGDAMLVLPRMHAMTAPATPAFLLASSLFLLVVSGLLASRFRESLRVAERRLQLHAWQLSKMVPKDAASPR